MKKLLLSLLSLFSLAVNAADFVVNGIAYNALSLTDLTCEVTNNSTLYSGEIDIPATVSFQNRIFTVTKIGDEAFHNCNDIVSIIIPNTITSIGERAFYGCNKLISLYIPGGVTSIGTSAFGGCSGLKKLHLEDGNSTLNVGILQYGKHNYSSFYECNIDTLYLGRNLTGASFKTGTYSSNRNTLSDITIGHGVTFINSNVFWCSKAQKIVIPSSITKICDDAFEGCDYEELIFEDGDTPIELGIHSQWDNAKLEYCVMRNYNLKTLHVGRNIKLAEKGSLGSQDYQWVHGFYNLTCLKNVTIGEKVTVLPYQLFVECDGIEKIILPKNLSNIDYAFHGCIGLMDITCQSLDPPSVSSSSFTNNQYLNAVVKVSEEAYETYKAHEVWGQFWNLTKANSSEIETKQCTKPTINFINRKLQFSCDTEGAEFHSSISCTDVKSYNENEISLEAVYEISVYATCYGYSQSEVTKAKLYWIDGTINTTEIQSVQSNGRGVLVLSNNGFLSISGLENNEQVTVYDISGKMIGSTRAFMGEVNFNVGNANKIILVKIGNESIKITM